MRRWVSYFLSTLHVLPKFKKREFPLINVHSDTLMPTLGCVPRIFRILVSYKSLVSKTKLPSSVHFTERFAIEFQILSNIKYECVKIMIHRVSNAPTRHKVITWYYCSVIVNFPKGINVIDILIETCLPKYRFKMLTINLVSISFRSKSSTSTTWKCVMTYLELD